MSEIIKNYYSKADIMPLLLKRKLAKFEKHPDIAKEFEYWIENNSYLKKDCVCINGYTAEKLAEMSNLLNGEGAFMLMIELRETPEKAMSKIADGFKLK